MPKPSRMSTDKAQRKLTVDVAFILEAGAVHVKGLNRTTCPELEPDRSHFTKQSNGTQVATSMTTEEYMSFLSEVLKLLKKKKLLAIWVQDRNTAHLFEAVPPLIDAQVHKVMVLWSCSPDLDPLDYAVFGHSKHWLDRMNRAPHISWEALCTAFSNHMEQLDHSGQVAGYPNRLLMVIQEKGGHIQDRIER
jgi:hypothetical protein